MSSDPSRGITILVIDDEPSVLQPIAIALESTGSVITADSGPSALARLREREYDVIVTDINLPGFSGFELYAWLASNRPGAERRMILMSGGSAAAHASAFAAVTGVHWLEKPFGLDQLRAAVERMLAVSVA